MSSISGSGGNQKSNVYITNDLIDYKVLGNRAGTSLFDTNGAYLVVISTLGAPYYLGVKSIYTIIKDSSGELTVFPAGEKNIGYSVYKFGYLSNIKKFVLYTQDTSGNYHLYISLTGDTEEEQTTPSISDIIIDVENNICLGLGSAKNLYITFDANRWIEFAYEQKVIGAGYLIKNNRFYILTRNLIIVTDRQGRENIINNISADSNIDLKLKNNEENSLLIEATYYSSVVMSYKNKYIGV